MNERFRHCLSMSKMLNAENILVESGIEPTDTTVNADKLLYQYAIEQCQSAALDELFNNPAECVQRYQAAHVILHALQFQTGSQEDKSTLSKYKEAVEKRLHILEEQGYVYAYETISNWGVFVFACICMYLHVRLDAYETISNWAVHVLVVNQIRLCIGSHLKLRGPAQLLIYF